MTGRIHSVETMGTVDGPGMRMGIASFQPRLTLVPVPVKAVRYYGRRYLSSFIVTFGSLQAKFVLELGN